MRAQVEPPSGAVQLASYSITTRTSSPCLKKSAITSGGASGVYLALILALGYTMVTITTLSLFAIATNGKVKGAGGVVLLRRGFFNTKEFW